MMTLKRMSLRSSTHPSLNPRYLASCIAICLIASLYTACGSNYIVQAQLKCASGVKLLKRRVGPEFKKLISTTALPVTLPKKYGCLYVFNRVLEEMPGEVIGAYGGGEVSDELAFLLYDSEGRSIITIPTTPRYRTTPVSTKIRLMDISKGSTPEVVVEERGQSNRDASKALRIFIYADGAPNPREVLSVMLASDLKVSAYVKTSWNVKQVNDTPVISIKGGGKEKSYLWDSSLQSYRPSDVSDVKVKRSLSSSSRSAPSASPTAEPTRATPVPTKPRPQVSDQLGDPAPSDDDESKTTADEFLNGL